MINQKVYLFSVIGGYNPPNDYLIINSKDKAIALLDKADIAMDFIPSYSISNGVAEIVISHKSDLNALKATVIAVADNNTNDIVIGNVITRKTLNDTACLYTVNIDWYTSTILSCYFYDNENALPVIARGIVRRSTSSKYFFKDEGIKPLHKRVSITGIKCDYVDSDGQRQTTSLNVRFYFMVYHENTTNTDHWIARTGSFDCKQAWDLYQDEMRIGKNKRHTYDPNTLSFYGYIVSGIDYLNAEKLGGGIYLLNSVVTNGDGDNKDFELSYEPFGGKKLTLRFDDFISYDYDEVTINDVDGLPLFSFPKGVKIGKTEVIAYLNPDVNTPSITYRFEPDYDSQSWVADNLSFTIMARPVTSYIDANQVYNAEQRVYNQQMRSLQAINNLVGGLTSASTEGALVGGFSRKGNPFKKGGLAMGIGIASAVIGYAYQTLYADKEQTKIEDSQALVSVDTLLFSSALNTYNLHFGLYHTKYDDETINNIKLYQSQYGYQSDEHLINTTVNMFPRGYIQTDIQLKPGLCKEVEDYICKMFSYGVTFNE